jgi:hypothetical protein
MVTVPPALIMIARDIWHDRHLWKKSPGGPSRIEPADSIPMELVGSAMYCKADTKITERTADDVPTQTKTRTLGSFYQDIRKSTLPTLFSILPRLPTSLVLFAFCMFILVQALTTWGWVEVFAAWWSAWVTACLKVGTGFATVGAVYLMLIISTFLCNVSLFDFSPTMPSIPLETNKLRHALRSVAPTSGRQSSSHASSSPGSPTLLPP